MKTEGILIGIYGGSWTLLSISVIIDYDVVRIEVISQR